ncbi:MAG: HtaA domain-containing protein [Nocardia sp.]|nr:HtaA domain-containing protein [Nocardia sp.]
MTTSESTGLCWAIKHSFVHYISRMPDGRGQVSGGARPLGGGGILFEIDTEPPQAPEDLDTLYAFRGDVRFAGHHGMLFVRIADPWIEVREGSAVVTVADPYDRDDEPRLPLVRVELPEPVRDGGLDIWTIQQVRLTPQGCGLFNDVYQPGEPFEPIVFALPAGARA